MTELGKDALSKITPDGIRTPLFSFAASTLPADVAIVPPLRAPVGGALTPVDKLAVLAPHVGSLPIAVLMTVLIVISPRKRSETEG